MGYGVCRHRLCLPLLQNGTHRHPAARIDHGAALLEALDHAISGLGNRLYGCGSGRESKFYGLGENLKGRIRF